MSTSFFFFCLSFVKVIVSVTFVCKVDISVYLFVCVAVRMNLCACYSAISQQAHRAESPLDEH